MSNVAESGEEHSIFWGNFTAVTMESAVQMFDITAKIVSDQDEINGLDKFYWEKNSWKQLSLINDETVINLQRTKVNVFSDSVLCLGRILQHPDSNEAFGRTELQVS